MNDSSVLQGKCPQKRLLQEHTLDERGIKHKQTIKNMQLIDVIPYNARALPAYSMPRIRSMCYSTFSTSSETIAS